MPLIPIQKKQMILIETETNIKAPIDRCFDLSTSIDLHKISASTSEEEAIAGRTEGLIQLHERVTWRAKHFGVWHKMEVQITEYDRPKYFIDEMLKGSFKFMKHTHEFRENSTGTLMIDHFAFASPLGIFGRIVDHLVLKDYMTEFLKERNNVIKEFSETDKWKEVLTK